MSIYILQYCPKSILSPEAIRPSYLPLKLLYYLIRIVWDPSYRFPQRPTRAFTNHVLPCSTQHYQSSSCRVERTSRRQNQNHKIYQLIIFALLEILSPKLSRLSKLWQLLGLSSCHNYNQTHIHSSRNFNIVTDIEVQHPGQQKWSKLESFTFLGLCQRFFKSNDDYTFDFGVDYFMDLDNQDKHKNTNILRLFRSRLRTCHWSDPIGQKRFS